MQDFLTRVLDYLASDSVITSYVGDNIGIESQPINVANIFSKITVRIEEDETNENGTVSGDLIINIWVNAKQYDAPFLRMREIKKAVFDRLSYSGNNILNVYGIRQKSSSDIFENDNKIWRGVLIFRFDKKID